MAEHQGWIVAEIDDNGDPDAVMGNMIDERYPDRFTSQQQGSSVVIYDDNVTTSVPVDTVLESICGHLDRVVIVESIEGGDGRTKSRYYEVEDDQLGEPVDELSTISRWFVESHFDYYAIHYGIDGAI
ncbi:hypothetical protein [Natronorubrum bangense]|uniref:Uncharacterized protein n=2 Tax=Natronorubrum bangense TaxID=61858 RepID=L9W803_9EURY|nr:hypothetical protein [Natronorubrum bangense]ELY45635.1 hypothetical protein C494_15338 [Natronorubrum bangense JCM 10635]QCC56497.1 hypothetical protein DV706_18505 [Natronorubrum bangense]